MNEEGAIVCKGIDDSMFFDFVGKSQNTKFLELFFEQREEIFIYSEIVDCAKIRRKDVKKLIEFYKAIGIIKVVKERKSREWYKLNQTNKYSKMLMKIYDSILKDRKKIIKKVY